MYLPLSGAGGEGNIFFSLLPFILMFAIFYFLLIRPQQKRQKTRNMMLANLKKGDKVVTLGGMHGKIVELTDDTIVIMVNDTTRMTFSRGAVESVVQSAGTDSE